MVADDTAYALCLLAMLLQDAMKTIVAICFVGFWMLVHTFSPFLTIMGILNLVLVRQSQIT